MHGPAYPICCDVKNIFTEKHGVFDGTACSRNNTPVYLGHCRHPKLTNTVSQCIRARTDSPFVDLRSSFTVRVRISRFDALHILHTVQVLLPTYIARAACGENLQYWHDMLLPSTVSSGDSSKQSNVS